MKNKDDSNDLVLIDEEKLLNLWKYLNENTKEVERSLQAHNKQLWKVFGKPSKNYDWIEKNRDEIRVRTEGFDPLKESLEKADHWINVEFLPQIQEFESNLVDMLKQLVEDNIQNLNKLK